MNSKDNRVSRNSRRRKSLMIGVIKEGGTFVAEDRHEGVRASVTVARGLSSPHSATREATTTRSPHTARKSSPCSPQAEKAHTW